MNKSILLATLMMLTMSLLLTLGLVTVSAAAGAGTEPRVTARTNSPPAGEDSLQLTSTFPYTIYLPTVYGVIPFNSKKGFGGRGPACADLTPLKSSWHLNWSTQPDSSCAAAEKGFVPRISKASDMANLSQAVANAQPSGWLIGFTEPDLPWQGNLSPAQAATYWRQIEQAAVGIKLVSPSPSQHSPGWLWQMVDAYRNQYGKNPRFDAIGWNIYKREPKDIQSFLTNRRNEAVARGYTVPIWVLEYGGECWNSASGKTGNETIMTSITPWFDKTSWIGRYAWFANRINPGESDLPGWQSCTLINGSNGQLTKLGNLYRNY